MNETLPLIALLIGLCVGYAIPQREIAYLKGRLRESDEDVKAVTDRLVSAWHDGAIIPPDARDVPGPIEEEALPDELAKWVAEWEGPVAQARWDAEIRRRLASGRTPDQILMDLETRS